jgi:hypothetical protein|tara:strand:+ start:522 stop:866 length:345 start_codon:yes stop_codon:yes gene_type:complete
MKISIDTKEDSHDDIRKVIKMLEHLVSSGGSPSYSNSGNIFDDPSPSLGSSEGSYGSTSDEPAVNEEAQSATPTNAFSAMFGGEAPAPVESEEVASYGDSEEKKLNLDEEIVPY